MGTKLLGRGALIALDAGLCELAVSLKSVREGAFQRASLGVACTVHIHPMFWHRGSLPKERWTGIPKGIESACQFGVRLDGSGRDKWRA